MQGGRAQFSNNYSPGVNTPGQEVPVMELASDEPITRTLFLGAAGGASAVANNPWPPPESRDASRGGSYAAGMLDFSGATSWINSAGNQCAAAVVQYGIGGVQETFWCDWKPGAINLPACTYVRCSVVPWGGLWGALTLGNADFVAWCVPGNLEGARPPTVSANVTHGATYGVSNTRVFCVPSKAAAFDVGHQAGTIGQLVVTVTTLNQGGAMYMVRDPSTGLYVPPWGPVQLANGSARMNVAGVNGQQSFLQFFLAL
jgi:hypothetical protein